MKLVHNNASIECESAEIISRKIIPSSFIELNNIGKCFSYKCSLNSEATIRKEISPKEPKVNENSLLNLDSKLECNKLFVAVKRNKPYRRLSVINFTGKHKAQSLITDEFTFAKITLQLSNIPILNPELKIKLVDK
ncbi:hypothetical protein [Peijinzhouia sedimentorum]